jgi:hypothetical protein
LWDLRFSWWWLWRMPSSGMLHHDALVRTGVLEECITIQYNTIIRVTRISELGTTLAVTSNWSMLQRDTIWAHTVLLCSMLQWLVTANVVPSSPILVTLMMKAIRSSEKLVLTRVTWYNIPEDGILHSELCWSE